MTISLSETIRNARLDVIETIVGVSGILKIRSGTVPLSADSVDDGDELAIINLPSDWMQPSVGGVKAKSGDWTDASADMTGTATYFRLYAADGVTCGMQGTVGTSSADMIVLTTSFVATQPFTITSFTLTDGN